MLRNCFWHSYHKVQQEKFSTNYQIKKHSSDNLLDDRMKINSNNFMDAKTMISDIVTF